MNPEVMHLVPQLVAHPVKLLPAVLASPYGIWLVSLLLCFRQIQLPANVPANQ